MDQTDSSNNVKTYIDLGCGLGKTCFYADATGKFNKIIGVDFGKEFIETANAYKQKSFGNSHVQFLKQDVTKFRIPEENCFLFAFNPFDDVVFDKFFQKNMKVLNSKKIYLGYSNDLQMHKIQEYFNIVYRDHTRRLSLWESK